MAFWLAGATPQAWDAGLETSTWLGTEPEAGNLPEAIRGNTAYQYEPWRLHWFEILSEFLLGRLGFGGVQALGVQASITQQCVGFEAADEESW